MKPYFLLYLFLIIVSVGNSQDLLENYNVSAFGNVLIQSKTFHINIDSIIIQTLLDQNITQTRYAEIIKSDLEGTRVNLTDKDKILLETIKQKSVQIAQSKVDNIKKLCLLNNITYEQYLNMEKMLGSDPNFRQQLIQYFELKSVEK